MKIFEIIFVIFIGCISYLAVGCFTTALLCKLDINSNYTEYVKATIFCWPIVWITLLFLFIIKAIKFSWIMLRSTYDLCKELFQVYK